MRYLFYHWDDETTAHLAVNDVSPDDFEEVVESPDEEHMDDAHPHRLVAYGPTSSGKYIACVYTLLDPDTVYPITAFKCSLKRARRRKPR